MDYGATPLKVNGERVWRTWPGGRELDRIHGAPNPEDGSFPEEWMLSTTRANNVGREDIEEGLCYVDGPGERVSLKSLIEADPRGMLGAAHVDRHGAVQGVLVKLIDAAARLQIQVHPDKATARRLFDSAFGKTECWHVLGLRDDAAEPPGLFLGFRPGIDPEAWREAFRRQDSPAMLSMLNRLEPAPGETFIVHGGVPHAIGAGCFIIEIQEPTDLTVRLEKKMPYGPELADAACHQGLGFERMFECFHYDGVDEAGARRRWRVPPRELERGDGYAVRSLVGYDVTGCFAMDGLTVATALPVPRGRVFSGLYVKGGEGRLECGGDAVAFKPNDQFFISAGCRDFRIVSTGDQPTELIRFHGPKV